MIESPSLYLALLAAQACLSLYLLVSQRTDYLETELNTVYNNQAENNKGVVYSHKGTDKTVR